MSPTLQVDTRDSDEARARLSDIYCPQDLTLVGGSDGFLTRQTVSGLPGLRLFELTTARAKCTSTRCRSMTSC